MREWFHHNQEYPYPDEDQRKEFMRETGFSQKRISTWFANARRRQRQKQSAARVIPRAGSPLITSTVDSIPMERWKASPPEDEPISDSVIENAIASGATGFDMEVDPFQFDEATEDFFNFDESSSHLASSVSSLGSRASETPGSVSSAWSHQSGEIGLPFPLSSSSESQSQRQRRQRGTGETQYPCTFCSRTFRKRHDWSRHEKSVHFTLITWICTPNLGELQENWHTQAESDEKCRFCDTPLPDESHWDEHDFSACAGKPLPQRSFRRKDYLWQHLRKFHGCTQPPVPDLDSWRGTKGDVTSRCGFCNYYPLPTWTARTEHLADHFKAGFRMEQWVGDWGLDASTLSILRNATLPSQRAPANALLETPNTNV